MTLFEKLEHVETIMHFKGMYGFGWYVRATGRSNKWGFSEDFEKAIDEALKQPVGEGNIWKAPPAPPEAARSPESGRVRIRPAATPPAPSERVSIRRNRGLFD